MTRAIAIALVLVAASAGLARADRVPQVMFGLDITGAAMPASGARVDAFGLGLGVEHPLAGKLRAFGEFDWLWVGAPGTNQHDDGTGQIARVGVRRALLATTALRSLRFFIDGELGGGLALTNQAIEGPRVLAHGLVGLRFGYHVVTEPTKTYEAAVFVRALADAHGFGGLAGIVLAWGD